MATRRQVNIYINGREVANNIKAITTEKSKVNRELRLMTRGTKEYEAKVKELRQLNTVIDSHRKKIRAVGSSWDKITKSGITKFAAIASSAFAVSEVINYGKELFNLAAQMELLTQKAQTVFGEALPQVTKAANENAKAMGLTTGEYIAASAAIGDLLIPMGFQREEAANISTELVNLSGALSEWTGGQIKSADVSKILSKALLGEREELKQLGISILETDVKARLAEKGLDKLTGTLLQQAKATATLELVTEKSLDAQTAFAENSDTMVRRQAELSAKISEVAEKLATALFPVFERLVGIADSIADGVLSIAEAFGAIADPAKAATDAFNDQTIAVNNLEKDLVPLVDRYEELKSKTELSKDEQDELKQVVSQIGDIVPTAVTEFGKYGEVLGISADKARDFVEAQKLLLRQQNSEAIDQNTKSLQQYERELEKINKQLNQRNNEGDLVKTLSVNTTGGPITNEINLTGEEIRQLRDRAAELEVQLKNTNNAVKILRGENVAGSPATQSPQLTPSKEEILQQAARAEELNKQREKQADKALKEVEKNEQKLFETVAKFREDARLAQLNEDDKKLEQIKARFNKEIEVAKDLENKGIAEATSQRIELERLREEAINKFLDDQANKRFDEQKLKREEREAVDLEEGLERAKRAAEAEALIKEEVNAALLSEQELQLLQLEEHYGSLIALAQKHGIDTVKVTAAFEKQKAVIAEKEAQVIRGVEQDLARDRLESYKLAADGLAQLVDENTTIGKSLFLFQKGVAIADVIINLQKELAGIAASNAGLGPFAPAVIAAQSTAAKVRSGIRIATIGATAIQGLTQKKDGGWLTVQGNDDGKHYNAKYIGQPGTGRLPSHPVVIGSNTGQNVLASENGSEYFVSNPDLRNPMVLNHVRAIDNIVRMRQFQEGGFTSPTTETPATSTPTNTAETMALVSAIDRLNSNLESGIIAVIPDQTAIDLQRRLNKLLGISGG